MILPFVEQTALHGQISTDRLLASGAMVGPNTVRISTFVEAVREDSGAIVKGTNKKEIVPKRYNKESELTAEVFMGLGLQCAKCHDHKFDPLLRKDYFRLRAFFAPILPEQKTIATRSELDEFDSKRKL